MIQNLSFLVYFAALNAALSSQLQIEQSRDEAGISSRWQGSTVRDLHREYHNIFRHGNRNAASHLWSSFILDRSPSFSTSLIETLFGGFCAVSGSPMNPHDYNRYRLLLDTVTGGKRSGFMHYCCWPCVCDTQDFIKVDTKTVLTAQGPHKYYFAVIGNPCDNPGKLKEPFVQPFSWGRETTLERDAPELRCENGRLVGATLSDHGYVIISMFFTIQGDPANDPSVNETTGVALVSSKAAELGSQQPGRVRSISGVLVQDEYEWGDVCARRARDGYNSGMGEIFRRVAAISPIQPHPTLPPPPTPAAAALAVAGDAELVGRGREAGVGLSSAGP